MAQQHRHLDLEDRCAIARLHEAGQSRREIAAALDRAPSTVSRELKRNRGAKVGYKPAYAQEQTRARRWTGARLERDDELRSLVLGCLKSGWSPEQIAGRLRQQKAATTISHESIYRFIYAQIRRTQDYAWRHYLPRAKFKRGCRGRKGGSPAQFIKDRVPIGKRPIYINARRQAGHWKPTTCCSAATASRCWLPRNVSRDLSCSPNRPAGKPSQPPPNSTIGSHACRLSCAAA